MSMKDSTKAAITTVQIIGTVASSVVGQPQTPIEQFAQYQKTQNTSRDLQVTTPNQTTSGKK